MDPRHPHTQIKVLLRLSTDHRGQVKNRITPFTDDLFQVIGAGDIADHAAHAPVLPLEVGADMIKQDDLLNALGFTARRAEPVKLTQSTRQAQT